MALELKDGGVYFDGLGERVVVALDGTMNSEFPFVRVNGDPLRYMKDGRYVAETAACSVYNLVQAA